MFDLLASSLAVHVPGLLPATECQRYSRGVLQGRADWFSDWGGEQFSLGRAWYTHLEQDREDAYFAGARASDASVERHAPGLQGAMLGIVTALVRAEARRRPGWCGPGVHVFPPFEKVARSGGVVHFDTEGLEPTQLARRARALSLVLMLQPPREGGGLKLWGLTYADQDTVDECLRDAAPAATITYGAGDLVVFDSYRLHQILPFQGDRERISATAHAVEHAPGRWHVWF